MVEPTPPEPVTGAAPVPGAGPNSAPSISQGAGEMAADAPQSGRRPRRRATAIGVLIAAAALVGGLAVWQLGRPTPAPALAERGAATGLPPLIAMVDPAGALVTVDLSGRRTTIATGPGFASGFPAWSPDGRRIAAIRAGAGDAALSIFAVSRDNPAPSAAPESPPVVVYRNADSPPFYVYWAPDGQRVSFLATEEDEVSLRIAPADGSAPLDGSGPGSMIRRGVPLYFDWITTDRLLLHVGLGEKAFLGEVGLDGAGVAPGLPGTGEFRSAIVGNDGRFVAFVRGEPPEANLVVAARDGSVEHTLPVFGPSAAVFDPTGTVVAAIAAEQPMPAALAFPLGPLRLIDGATGNVRTLLDGTVVSFFWAPDGRTIAALRLQSGSGSTTAGGPIVRSAAFAPEAVTAADEPSAAPSQPAPTPLANPELHLLFVNVADGAIRSDRVVQLSRTFVNQFLPYFDQYALSHRVWAPDSSALLLPLVDPAGADRLVILPPDGTAEPTTFDGQSGFWSP